MTNEDLAHLIYSGQNDLLNDLFLQNRKLICKISASYYRRNFERLKQCGIELDDLINESYFVLSECVKAFCESHQDYKFTTFLKYPLINCFNTIAGLRTKTAQKEPINTALRLEAPTGDLTEDITLGETIPDEKAEFENDILMRMTIGGVFGAVKNALQDYPLYYDVIHMKYVQGLTGVKIAEKLGVSHQYVNDIINKAMRILRHPKSKTIREYRDEIIGTSIRMSGLKQFEYTGNSSVEWAVKKLSNTE